ncbi:hypothetical protein [Gryllotalpicola protaetiae]|uniref:Nucleotidyltransferase family protein n=1 Tax=Gryllotalpicola protaetiae TaxID=2419771 RepID=A0A387BPR0_9MICO|nr:hypothetical protein [Gryllotalpicola protaetiae]AYG03000.1 hypothetical protein D7I44_05305 [Gryllotalpicola protaetiae]
MIELWALSVGQEKSWNGLLDVSERLPGGWTLVGGQMVQLHCFERGQFPSRPTDDADAVLDVRAEPQMLWKFTAALRDVGFEAEPPNANGYQHRWVREGAVVDVLIPRHLGERATRRRGVSGATTLPTPGAQAALDRSSQVAVSVNGRVGTVNRPDLTGAIAAKSAAWGVVLDQNRGRHLIDVLTLALLLDARDNSASPLSSRELQRVAAVVGELSAAGRAAALFDEGERALQMLVGFVRRQRRTQ